MRYYRRLGKALADDARERLAAIEKAKQDPDSIDFDAKDFDRESFKGEAV